MWAYVNGLMDRQTQIFLNAQEEGISLRELKQFSRGLIQHFPKGILKPADYAFDTAAESLYCMVIVNLGADPMEELTRRGLQLLSNKTNALDYGTQHINLAIQFDLIQLNSWGEIVVSHYEHDRALPDALTSWHASLPDNANHKPELFVKSYSITRPESISRRINDLWNSLTEAWYKSQNNGALRFIFKLSNQFCMLESIDGQAAIKFLDYEHELYNELQKESHEFKPVQFDSETLPESPLPLIYQHNTAGEIELFYHVEKDQAKVWILDEYGSLFYQVQYFYDHDSMLNHYLRFFQSIMLRRQAQQVGHEKQLKIRFYQIGRSKRQGNWIIRTERNLSDSKLSHYFNIQVIASEGMGGEPMYTFYCDNEEISPLEYGNKVLTAVARKILRHRSNEERYPSYITDLDISALTFSSQGTCHHLKVKKELEDNLYEELNKA